MQDTSDKRGICKTKKEEWVRVLILNINTHVLL